MRLRLGTSAVTVAGATELRDQTSWSALRKKSPGSSGGRCAPGALDIGNLSMKSTRFYRAYSLGSRILAAGLLPLPQLRCSCQGEESLTQDIQRSRAARTAATTLGISFSLHPKKRSLRRAHEISQRGLNRLLRGLNRFTRKPCEART